MRIKWTDGLREVPGIGLINTGDIREVSDDLGKSLIKQGQAKEIKPEKIEGRL